MFRYAVGEEGARRLGYDPVLLESAPATVTESFCGVGNPFAIASVGRGERLLDIGCGGGFDLVVAQGLVGLSGEVHGLDLTGEMVAVARSNCQMMGSGEITINQAEVPPIPYADNSFTVVISNGVINLSPKKPALFQEIMRVLQPGGRLQFADIVLTGDLPPRPDDPSESWAQ